MGFKHDELRAKRSSLGIVPTAKHWDISSSFAVALRAAKRSWESFRSSQILERSFHDGEWPR